MSDPILISFPIENDQSAQSLARTFVERGLATSVEISGPVARRGTYLGTYVEQLVWRLTCRTTTDHRAQLEALAVRTINRREVELNVIALLPGESERPVDS